MKFVIALLAIAFVALPSESRRYYGHGGQGGLVNGGQNNNGFNYGGINNRGTVNGGQNNNGFNYGGINNRGTVNGGQNNNGVNFGGINNREVRGVAEEWQMY